MIHHGTNRIVAQPAEDHAAVDHFGFSLLSLPSKYPPVVRSQRKRPLRLIRETRRRFPPSGRAKFAIHSDQKSAVGDDDRRDVAT